MAYFSDHIRAAPEPPVLIGHSVGGLLVQLLIDRRLGRAAAALDPAPIRVRGAFSRFVTVSSDDAGLAG